MADRLDVIEARRGYLRLGELIVNTFGEAPHREGEPCLFQMSDEDLVAALERELDQC